MHAYEFRNPKSKCVPVVPSHALQKRVSQPYNMYSESNIKFCYKDEESWLKQGKCEGTQPGFPFPNPGDPLGTPTDWKKNLAFILNLFNSEFVEQTHLYSYVFH